MRIDLGSLILLALIVIIACKILFGKQNKNEKQQESQQNISNANVPQAKSAQTVSVKPVASVEPVASAEQSAAATNQSAAPVQQGEKANSPDFVDKVFTGLLRLRFDECIGGTQCDRCTHYESMSHYDASICQKKHVRNSEEDCDDYESLVFFLPFQGIKLE